MKKVNVSGVNPPQVTQVSRPTVLVNGVEMTGRDVIEFVGDGVLGSDDAVNDKTTLAISSNLDAINEGSVVLNTSADFNADGTSFSANLRKPSVNNEVSLEYRYSSENDQFNDSSNLDLPNSPNLMIGSSTLYMKGDFDFSAGRTYGSPYYTSNNNDHYHMSGNFVSAIGQNSVFLSTALWDRNSTWPDIGQDVLLINMQATNQNYIDNVGNFEFLKVSAVNTGTREITFSSPIQNWYGDNIGTQTLNYQLVFLYFISTYVDFTLDACGLYGTSWGDGSWGDQYGYGVIVVKATNSITLKNNASIHAEGRGFRGGGTFSGNGGEGWGGLDGQAGGGAYNYYNGYSYCGAGGGGAGGPGNGNSPTTGSTGAGGAAWKNGDPKLRGKIYLGGGGGYSNNPTRGSGRGGGNGGGIIMLIAPNITLNGANIYAYGNNGDYSASSDGGSFGGSGGGGSILVLTKNLTVGSNNVQAFSNYVTSYARQPAGGGGFISFIYKTKNPTALVHYEYPNGTFGEYPFTDYLSTAAAQSKNLVSGRTITSIDRFQSTVPYLPPNTSVQVQFSDDNGVTWKNASGVANQKTAMHFGDNDIALSGFNAANLNFKYKLSFASDGLDTPKVDNARIVYSPPSYATTPETWASAPFSLADGRVVRPKNVTFAWDKVAVNNAYPKVQIQGSNDKAFSTFVAYPSSSDGYQQGGAYDIQNGVTLDISDITAFYKYWRFVVTLNAGGNSASSPVLKSVGMDFLIKPADLHISIEEPYRPQTVVSGIADSTGLPTFLTIDPVFNRAAIDGSSSPLVMSFSDKQGATTAEFNAIYSLNNLIPSATNFVFADLSVIGGLTFDIVTVAPQAGYSYPAGSEGLYFFHIPYRTMYRYTNGGWVKKKAVFLGEFAVNASGVPSACVNYAIGGRYSTGWMGIAASTAYTINHNIGLSSPKVEKILVKETTTGEVADMIANGIYSGAHYGVTVYDLGGRNTLTARAGSYPYWDFNTSYTTNLVMNLEVDRGWM